MRPASKRVLQLTAVVIVFLVGLSWRLHAQSTPPTPEPAFEVASVKANKSGAPYVGGPGDRFSDGQYQTTNIPLRLLMRQAFERWQAEDVVGGPAWLDRDRWDIVAKAESRTVNMLPMIRSLLAERFKLTAHYDTKERPIYLLTVARRDGRLGPSLRPATGPVYSLGSTGIVTGRAVTMRQLAILLGSAAGRPVTDRTDLRDTYDVDLKWTPTGSGGGAGGDVARDGPDVFTAIQEQLGLKLEPSRGPVDVMVIDRVERPTED